MRRLLAVCLLVLSATFVLAPHAATPAQTTAAPATPLGNPAAAAPAGPSMSPPLVTPSAETGTLPETKAPAPRQIAPNPYTRANSGPTATSGNFANSGTAQRPTSTPYTGDLSIFEDPNRDKLLQTGKVLDTLRLHPGSDIADIGAGGGWFTVRAARRVGPNGHVYAEDINPKAVEAIRTRAQNEHLADITAVLGTPDDPRLTPDSLDAALMLRVYHEVAHTDRLLPVLVRALRPGARFAVIDHPGNGADHGINPEVVRAEVTHAGLRYVGLYDFTKADQNDYMEVFEKR